ncbi:MAG: lamin tail domain-containing protein [Verrucomicrobiales bacterium]|nr:lamin tail domain-containing protein [Verrucomicrobiales bacterium]
MFSTVPRRSWVAPFVYLALLSLTLTLAQAHAATIPSLDALVGVVLGESPAGGSFTNSGGSVQIQAQGAGIGTRGDQGVFAYASHGTNDFDVKVRVERLDPTSLIARAGIVVRDQTASSTPMAAIVATPGMSGVQFLVRTSAESVAAISGYHSVSFPNTWLRLQRSNDVLRGFASFDGRRWTQVGKAPLILTNVLLGLAASSGQANATTTAVFRDWSDASGDSEDALPPRSEPPGPSSRRTALAITEVHYNPPGDPTEFEPSLQFIELFNSDFTSKELGGFRLEASAMSYVFPTNATLAAGGYLVVARNPEVLRTFYTNLAAESILGPWEGNLGRGDDTVRLWSPFGALLLEIPYSDRSPWPLAADGEGHSIVLARPSYGESDPRAWAASPQFQGSPGRADGFDADPRRGLRITEVFGGQRGNTGPFIEIFNAGVDPAPLDDLAVTGPFANSAPRIALPPTLLEPGSRLLIDIPTNTPLPSPLFIRTTPNAQVWDAVSFSGTAAQSPLGRLHLEHAALRRVSAPTPGLPNAAALPPKVVISEVMYRPISGRDDDQYLELWNPGTDVVPLQGWRLKDGVEFEFPAGLQLSPGERAVVARNAARLRQTYTHLPPSRLLGEFSGRLAGQGERITLLDATGAEEFSFTYRSGGEWPTLADGGGSSLELLHPGLDPDLGSNWAASDESHRAAWQTYEITGPLEGGRGAITDVRLILLDPGETLVDDVEVVAEGSTNLLANPDFESGLNGWTLAGTHERSSLSTNGGFGSSAQALLLRAYERGDNGINSARATLRTGLRNGTNTTLRIRARWLAGTRDLLVRVRGNYLELPIRLAVPEDLGTPGLPNSRSIPAPRPALSELAHFPVLPAEGQPVRVTVRISGLPNANLPVLHYRLDPSAEFAPPITMTDSGTEGDRVADDGLFTGVIPGQAARIMAAFHVTLDSGDTEVRTPSLSPGREALVRWGEAQPAGNLGVYRIWITRATESRWSSRPKLHNGDLDGTFVYGSTRAVYGLGTLYSGSPFVSPGYNGPAGSTLCGYVLHFPEDDALLGETDFVMDWPIRDDTRQLEQRAYEFAADIGLPYLHRRFIHLYVNSSKRGSVYEDTQQPGSAYLRNWAPDDNDGNLHKIEDWFEFTNSGDMESNEDAYLADFRRSDGSKNTARYRWSFRPRAVQNSSHDFEALFRLVDAAAPPTQLLEFQRDLEREMDVEQWAGIFAVEHAVGNWDSFGYRRGKNMYAYRPERGPWRLFMWDIDFVMSAGGEGPNNYAYSTIDGTIAKLYQHAPFQRAYWRAVKKLVLGPMRPERFNARTEAVRLGLLDNGINSTSLTAARNWVRDQRNNLLTQLDQLDNEFSYQSNVQGGSTTSPVLYLQGQGPIEMTGLLVNGEVHPVNWLVPNLWVASIPLQAGRQTLSFAPVDAAGRNLSASRNLSVTLSETPLPESQRIVINEIHANPKFNGAAFVELHNPSATQAIDLSDLLLVGSGRYAFPPNTLLFPGQWLVLAQDVGPFQSEFGRTQLPAARLPWVLPAHGETLAVVRPAKGTNPAVTLTAVTYRPDGPWPASTPGRSLQLRDPARGEDDRVGDWATYSPPTNASPWKEFSVEGPAGGTNLLLYIASFPPSLTPTDIAGRWIGNLSTFGFDFAADFTRDTAGTLSGRFYAGDTTGNPDFPGSELGDVTAGTDGSIRFTWTEIDGRFTGRIDASGRRATGTFTFQGGSSPFTLTRQLPAGTVWVEDLKLTRKGDETNLIRNGGFDADITNEWQITGAHQDSARVETSGPLVDGLPQFALRLTATSGGNGSLSNAVSQSIPNVVTGVTYRLSGRYQSVEAQGLVIGLEGGPRFFTDLRPRIDAGPDATPGRPNSVAESLSPIPLVWVNEVQPRNSNGLRDAAGEAEPWLELHNSGASAVSLDGFFLTDNPAEPRKWAFPNGYSLAAGGFLVVWMDGESSESSSTAPHAGFRINEDSGVVILSRDQSGGLLPVDFLRYSSIPESASFGHLPETWVHADTVLSRPSPGQSNVSDPGTQQVWINEWMASNDGSVRDPADLDADDWFELHNAGTSPVDLEGWLLTDALSNLSKFRIPAGYVIPPHGFLLVWADEESGQNAPARPDLHVNFRLSSDGEEIVLSRPDGSIMDHVRYTRQNPGESFGRYPDGAPGTEYILLANPSPGSSNSGQPNTGPQIVMVERRSDGSFLVRVSAEPGTQYRLRTKEDLGQPTWTSTAITVTASGPFADLAWPADDATQRFFQIERLP